MGQVGVVLMYAKSRWTCTARRLCPIQLLPFILRLQSCQDVRPPA